MLTSANESARTEIRVRCLLACTGLTCQRAVGLVAIDAEQG